MLTALLAMLDQDPAATSLTVQFVRLGILV
jgi:hypothetical protein